MNGRLLLANHWQGCSLTVQSVCGTDNAAGSWWLEPGFHLSFMEDNPPYPFQRIKHVDGKDTGVMAIIAPFYDLDYYKVRLARQSASLPCCDSSLLLILMHWCR